MLLAQNVMNIEETCMRSAESENKLDVIQRLFGAIQNSFTSHRMDCVERALPSVTLESHWNPQIDMAFEDDTCRHA
jgi:hypothetical protein